MTLDEKALDDLEDIRELIAEESGADACSLMIDTPLVSSGLLDSFALVAILALVEEHTGAQVAPEDLTLDNFDTLGRVASLMERLR